MKRIESFSAKQNRTLVSDAALAALQKVADSFGLTVERGAGSYAADQFSVKIVFKAPAAASDKAADDFSRYATMCDCDPSWFGKSFVSKGETLTVVGIAPNRPKNCILLKSDAGKSYKCGPSLVRSNLSK